MPNERYVELKPTSMIAIQNEAARKHGLTYGQFMGILYQNRMWGKEDDKSKNNNR